MARLGAKRVTDEPLIDTGFQLVRAAWVVGEFPHPCFLYVRHYSHGLEARVTNDAARRRRRRPLLAASHINPPYFAPGFAPPCGFPPPPRGGFAAGRPPPPAAAWPMASTSSFGITSANWSSSFSSFFSR